MGHILSSMRSLSAFSILHGVSGFRQKYWRASNEKARPVLFLAPPKLSAAQQANEDVLIIIFSSINTLDLASCAAVCKAWLEPAQRRLYANVTLHAKKKSAPLLASALRNNAALRSYIRRINLTQRNRKDGINVFDWLMQLPSSGIQRIDVTQLFDDPQFLMAFSQSPALRGVHHLSLNGLFLTSGAKLEDYLSLPSLENLSISLPPGHQIPNVSSAKPIKRFGVVSYSYEPWISGLLHVYSPSLVRLDIFCSEWVCWESLAEALLGLCHLQELFLFAPYRAPFPFLDDVIPRLLELQSLSCPVGAWSPVLLRALPQTCRVLKLHVARDLTYPLAETISAISGWCAAGNDMRCLILMNHSDPETLQKLGEACELAMMEFKWEEWTDDLRTLLEEL